MGHLVSLSCQNEDDVDVFKAVVSAVDELFPKNWRSWSVYNYSFQEVFVEKNSQKIDAKIRFALPVTILAKAFDPLTQSISERRFRYIKSKLLSWPLDRALLYAPYSLMEKIHADYNSFMNSVRELKPTLTSRQNASSQLKQPDQSPYDSSSSAARKRSSSPTLNCPSPKRRIHQDEDSNSLLAATLNKQMEMFNKLLSISTEQNENIKKLIDRNTPDVVLNESFTSVPDSTASYNEIERPCSATSVDKGSTDSEYQINRLREKIADAQRQLVSLQTGESAQYIEEKTLDFSLFTTEKEPKVAKADPELLRQGIDCQRLGQESWRNVRYAETQKFLQATPAFCSLKRNNILAAATPYSKSTAILEKADMTLGAITNGLLQQRKYFQSLLQQLPKDSRRRVGKDFLDANSNFRKVSDNLLQYVCG